ncbi:hypothetical protein EVAR_43883_1 [Eumeta japonica]|uniref:Uncharacterized protein n=1 Tax=Eumeta variegata TaxID=151549 RepID=A0A4C1WQ86_EUMVA|nr:hypothetical protein EVAR_43883_1 [Eumeta japonica]
MRRGNRRDRRAVTTPPAPAARAGGAGALVTLFSVSASFRLCNVGVLFDQTFACHIHAPMALESEARRSKEFTLESADGISARAEPFAACLREHIDPSVSPEACGGVEVEPLKPKDKHCEKPCRGQLDNCEDTTLSQYGREVTTASAVVFRPTRRIEIQETLGFGLRRLRLALCAGGGDNALARGNTDEM